MLPYILILIDTVPIFFMPKIAYFIYLFCVTAIVFAVNKLMLKSVLLMVFICWGFLSCICIVARYVPDSGVMSAGLENVTALEGTAEGDSYRLKGGSYLCRIRMDKLVCGNAEIYLDKDVTVIYRGEKLYWGERARLDRVRISDDRTAFFASRCKVVGNCGRFFYIRKQAVEIFIDKIDCVFGQGSFLAEALFVGNRDDLPLELKDMFRRAGLSHVLALSGMHLGIISLFVFFLIRRVAGQTVSLVTVNCVNVIYLLLAGISPSLLRSVIMFFLISLAKITGCRMNLMKILFFAFSVSLMAFPEYFFSLSFQLSFLALAGIILLTSNISVPFERFLPAGIASGIACSIAAVIGTGAVSLHTFGIIYPGGIISSVIVSPAVMIYMCGGLAVMMIPMSILHYFLPFVQSVFNGFYWLILKIVAVFSYIPGITAEGDIPFWVFLFFQLIIVWLIYFPCCMTRIFKRFR